jgi:hypothetical protein
MIVKKIGRKINFLVLYTVLLLAVQKQTNWTLKARKIYLVYLALQ